MEIQHWQSSDSKIKVFNCDYKDLMKLYDNNFFNLAIVDPPYGIGIAKKGTIGSTSVFGGKNKTKRTKAVPSKSYGASEWDSEAPDQNYFDELLRISQDQIVFGANHFISKLPFDSSCWVVWDKQNSGDWADCELAWTSFKTAVRLFQFRWNGMLQGDMKNKEVRIHITQKPVQLYSFLLKNYARPGFKIIDTHMGSGSIAVAIDKANKLDNMNLEFIACEKDPVMYEKAVKRIAAQEQVQYLYSKPEESFQQGIFDEEE